METFYNNNTFDRYAFLQELKHGILIAYGYHTRIVTLVCCILLFFPQVVLGVNPKDFQLQYFWYTLSAMNKNIYGVLNADKMQRFCAYFDIDINDLDVNFEGWSKVALLTDDTVFIFPRTPNGAIRMDNEIAVYKAFAHRGHSAMPKLKEVVDNQDISYYRFVAVERIPGILLSDVFTKIPFETLRGALMDMAHHVSQYHAVAPDTVTLPMKHAIDAGEIGTFLARLFVDGSDIHELVQSLERDITHIQGQEYALFSNVATYQRAYQLIEEICNLSPVLLHYDLHEGQIIIGEHDHTHINGIIDWESARVGNPVLDFNFFQWDGAIFKWRDHFITLRECMWRTYCEKRTISISSVHGLHLLYTLAEIYVLVEQREKDEIPLTGCGFHDSMRGYTRTLLEIEKYM